MKIIYNSLRFHCIPLDLKLCRDALSDVVHKQEVMVFRILKRTARKKQGICIGFFLTSGYQLKSGSLRDCFSSSAFVYICDQGFSYLSSSNLLLQNNMGRKSLAFTVLRTHLTDVFFLSLASVISRQVLRDFPSSTTLEWWKKRPQQLMLWSCHLNLTNFQDFGGSGSFLVLCWMSWNTGTPFTIHQKQFVWSSLCNFKPLHFVS